MYVIFENVKILFVFHFYALSVLVLRYSYQCKAAGAYIAKYQPACLSVCLSFCPSGHLYDCPACPSDCLLCHFFLSVILLVDPCHMCLEQSLPTLGLCCLSPSAPEFVSWFICVCLHVFVPVHSHVGLGYVCVHVCTSISVLV